MAERFMTVAMVDDNMADCMQYNRDLVLFAKLRNVSLFSKCQDFEESSELYLLLRIFYYAFYSHIHHVLIRLMTWYDTHFHDCTLFAHNRYYVKFTRQRIGHKGILCSKLYGNTF